jgi:histidine triad (HIT) family protein
MAECIFCRIVGKAMAAEVVYEDEHVLAFLDIHPSVPGHTLVIPRFHAETLDRLPETEVGPLFLGVRRVMALLEQGLKPAGLNVGWNHGWAAGQRVEHLHVHLLPRRPGDGGTGVQFLVQGGSSNGLADVASRIRAAG